MTIYVLVGCYQGVVDVVNIFGDQAKANEDLAKIKKEYGIPEDEGGEGDNTAVLYTFENIQVDHVLKD